MKFSSPIKKFQEKVIKRADEIRYLGVTIDNEPQKEHIKRRTKHELDKTYKFHKDKGAKDLKSAEEHE